MRNKLGIQIPLLVGFALLFAAHNFAMAYDFSQTVSTQDQATFNQILQPVLSIYNLVKYAATVIAAVALLFALRDRGFIELIPYHGIRLYT